ncbi:melanoma-associated antigen B16 [Culicoides brevitarsis]|uniref:melanoma-associated antigen B16 n=1 Tax=Culicoides brevitarsis TaxID=469753 RepID=UPI00307BF2EA
MPRGRARRPLTSDNDDDDSEQEISQSQSRGRKSQKLSQTPKEAISSAQMNNFVTKTVKMLLPYAASKLAVKRADLTKEAMNGEQRVAAQVISLARDKLNQIYDLDVVELKEPKIKQFIVVSMKPAAIFDEYMEDEKPEIVLLYLILEYIYMQNGEISDSVLYEYLRRFEIHLDEEHEYFGDVKHLINDVFPKRHYLTFVKHISEGAHTEKTTIKWGERAEHEILKREMLDAVAESLGCESTTFLQQYEDAYGADPNTLQEEIENLQMSSQPGPSSKPRGRRSRAARAEAMDVDDSD